MNENEETLDINEVNPEVKRPVFITVLCILTFVGAGIGLLGALWSLFTIGQVQNTYEALDSFGGFGDGIGNGMEDFYRWSKISVYLNLLGNAMCLTGALVMWNLKKVGYFIYVPGQIIPLIGSFMIISSMSNLAGAGPAGGMLANFGMLGFVLGALFPAAFIIMYGVNLKHMK